MAKTRNSAGDETHYLELLEEPPPDGFLDPLQRLTTCLDLPSPSASPGTASVITEPAAT